MRVSMFTSWQVRCGIADYSAHLVEALNSLGDVTVSVTPFDHRPHPRSLTPAEQAKMLALLHSERFQDSSPRQVWATVLDEGEYLCSISTMYRLLRGEGESQERRNQRSHPTYTRPELLATARRDAAVWRALAVIIAQQTRNRAAMRRLIRSREQSARPDLSVFEHISASRCLVNCHRNGNIRGLSSPGRLRKISEKPPRCDWAGLLPNSINRGKLNR